MEDIFILILKIFITLNLYRLKEQFFVYYQIFILVLQNR